MFRIVLLNLFIFPVFSLDINKIYSGVPKNFLEIRTACYLNNDENIINPGPGPCPTVVHLYKKFKNTKTFDRYVACHNVKADYFLLKPKYCIVTYCTPCSFKEV
jgi:hypothetical protein